MTIQIPATLKDKINKQEIIPIVAAGVSMSLKNKKGGKVFPSWTTLLERAAEQLEKEGKVDDQTLVLINIRKKRLQAAAQEAKEGLTGSLWNQFLTKQFSVDFSQVDEESIALPREIWRLSNKLITLNYDKTLLWSHPQPSNVCSFDNSNTSQLGNFTQDIEQSSVWHLHGHIDNPEHMVLTPESYQCLYQDDAKSYYKAALQKLRELLSTKSLLFIGCSMSDLELITEISKQSDLFSNNTGPHYVLLHESTKDTIGQQINADKKLFEVIYFSDFGEPLVAAIKQLADCKVQNIDDAECKKYIHDKVVESNQELETKLKFDKITVMVGSPLDSPLDDSLIKGKLQKFKFPVFEQALTEQNLLNSDAYSILILLAKHTSNGLMIEDDNACRDYLPIEELEDYLPVEKKLVILITDKSLSDEDISKVSFPFLVLTLLNKKGKELKILDKLPIQLFRKCDTSAFLKNESIQLTRLTNTSLKQLYPQPTSSADIDTWQQANSKLPPTINPSDLAAFTGRQYDLTAISQKLNQAASHKKLLTIKGSGGLGKTTTAQKIAIELAKRGRFEGGISFIDCEHLTSAKQLEIHIGSAFNLQTSDDLFNYLAEHHDGRARLIIFDNLESLLHLNGSSINNQITPEKSHAEQIKTLLSYAVRYASILVTSRESINCEWEEVYPFRAMESEEALILFNQFTHSAYTSAEEQEYLRRKILEPMLDNNPLAIKLICGGLAPGRSLKALKKELEEDFFNRVKEDDLTLMFDNEVDGNINRQESLYVSILYSYRTLTEGQKRAFECMSLFPDGINLDSFQRLVNESKSQLRINASKPSTVRAKRLVSDKDIKVLKDKSLLEVQGKRIKLQSIINRFSHQQFQNRTLVDNQVTLYREALSFNQQLATVIDKLDDSRDKRAILVFSHNIQNLFSAVAYGAKNSVIKNEDEIIEYLDFINKVKSLAIFVNLSSELLTIIDNIEVNHPSFVEGLSEQAQLAWEALQISLSYFDGEFESAFCKLQQKISLNQLDILRTNDVLGSLVKSIAHNLYCIEGHTFDCLEQDIRRNDIFGCHIPSSFSQTGFDCSELLPWVNPTLSYFEALDIFPSGINNEQLQQTLINLHESQHLERVQLTYTQAKLKANTVIEVDKLVSVNPYTRGLKLLMHAFANEEILKDMSDEPEQEEQVERIIDYYLQALPQLKHIKFYYTQAYYYYARFLQTIEHKDYQVIYETGLNFTQEYHYRYWQHKFLLLENIELGGYLPENYPLPNNPDISKLINKQIKWVNQNHGCVNPFYQKH